MDDLLKAYMQPAVEVIAERVEADLLDFYADARDIAFPIHELCGWIDQYMARGDAENVR
jgi:hypothetical protein